MGDLFFNLVQISRASSIPESTYIAKPAASWLDDFLVWLSPEAFGCCRKFLDGSYCPPDDQVSACLLWELFGGGLQLRKMSGMSLVTDLFSL